MKRIKNWIRDEQGAVVVWLAGGSVALVGIGALAVDVGNVYMQETRLKMAADTAVLAAARELNKGPRAVKAAGVEYAQKNLPAHTFGTVLMEQDVIVGTWNPNTSAFSAGGIDPNAIRVTLRRSAGGGNAVESLFAGIIGHQDMDIVVSAVASRPSTLAECFARRGFLAGEKVNFGQDGGLDAGLCVYGRDAVQFGQDVRIRGNSKIGAVDVNTITFGQNPSVPPDALVEGDYQPEIAQNITQILNDWEAGRNLPSHITDVKVLPNLPNGNLQPGTAYIINNSISIDQDRTYSDVIIATRESISFGQNGAVRNSAGTCSPGGGLAIGLYAVKNIAIGQDASVVGVQIVAGESVTIGQDLKGLSASIQAGKDIIISQDPSFSSCQSAMTGTRLDAGLTTAVLVQ